MKNKSMKRINWKRITTIGLSLVHVLLVYFLVGIFFETNDDRIISEILSGAYTGTAEAHVVYVNYLLALPLKWLYCITTTVPWYGLYLVLQHFIAGVFLFDSVYDCCDDKRWRIGGLLITFLLLLAHIYLLGQIQYTSTAALLALVGYVCLILQRSRRKGLLLFWLFELLAILLREDAMLMIQPFGMAAYMGLQFGNLEEAWRIKGRHVLCTLGVLLTVVIFGFVGNKIGYSEKNWDEYHRFNDASVVMYDYYGAPSYEEVHKILNAHHVTKAEYEAYTKYTILEGKVNADVAEQLAEYVVNRQKEQLLHPRDLLPKMRKSFFQDYYWGMNIMTLAAWAVAFLVLILLRNGKMLLPMFGVFCAHMIVWGYLLWYGRTPLRVTLPLLLAETILLWTIILTGCRKKKLPGVKQLLLVGACICVCAIGAKAFSVQIQYLQTVNSDHHVYMQGMKEIQDYCMKHPERRYLVEATTLNYYKGSVLEKDIYGRRNYMITGGWYSYSPPVRDRLRAYFGDWKSGVRLIIHEDQKQMTHPTVRYLKEKTGFEAVEEEKLPLSNGGSCVIYRFGDPSMKEGQS